MADYRSEFLKSVEENLTSLVEPDKIVPIADMITRLLNGYEITERCTDIVPADSTNMKLIKRYCACLTVDGKSRKTIYQYSRTLIRLSNALEKPFTEIGTYDIRYFLACEKERGVSNRSLENLRSNLSAFFRWMTREELIHKDPMDVVCPIKYEDEVRKPFSDIEIDNLRDSCETTRERAIVEVLLSSGVRVSELSSMDVTDIDTTTLTVHVRHGKGGKERITYITPVAANHLNKYLLLRKEQGTFLFGNKNHRRIDSGGIRYILNNLGKKAGVSNVHPHRFRRTFASGLASRGMEIQEIQKLLGHSNINTTLKYVCVNDERVMASYKKYIA